MDRPDGVVSRGARVGVVAPGYAVERDRLERGLAALTAMGFEPVLGRSVHARSGYLAGDDDARADDLVAMLDGAEIDALWFARGGYGATRLLDRLPWRRWRRRPLPWIGYSDNSALLWTGLRHGACAPLYGPVVTELGRSDGFHRAGLLAALGGREQVLRLRRDAVLVEGRAHGPVVGGNLTVLTHLLGTRHRPRANGCVLFLEDVGEPCYRVDRMLTQWAMAGALDGVRAVLLGSLRVPRRTHFPPDRRLGDVLRERFEPLGVPVCRGLPFGHLKRKRTLPLGVEVRVDTRAGTVRVAGR